jgi:hypothetical protein
MVFRNLFGPALLVTLLLQACAPRSSIPDLPEQIVNEDGILVARAYMPGNRIWKNAQVSIDGYLRDASLRDGYLAITLPPGSHKLNHLRISGWQTSRSEFEGDGIRLVRGGGGYRPPVYTYTPGSTTYYTTLPINRSFTIESGKITNLGMLVFLVDSKDSEKKQFFTVTTDNSADMKRFLAANYPKLMASVGAQNVRLDAPKLLEAEKLPELRKVICARESLAGRVIPVGRDMVSFGGLGALTLFKAGPDGKLASADVLDTGTLADMVDARLDGNRVFLMSADATLFVLENGKLQRTPLPYNRHMVKLYRFGATGLAVIDNRFRISTSSDLGRSWTDYSGAQLEIPSSDIGVFGGKTGFYVWSPSQGVPTALVFRPYDSAAYRKYELPSRGDIYAENFSRLVERPDGLYLVYAGSRSFHVLPDGKPLWLKNEKPDSSCRELMFDDAQNVIRTKCDSGTFESRDAGVSWRIPGA